MIPGQAECPILWTKEYDGYLMTSQLSNSNNKEYVCVDEYAEVESDTKHENKQSSGLFFVSADCSEQSLMPCSDTGYKAKIAITCVICTK